MRQPSATAAFRRIYDEHHADVLAYCLRRAKLEDAKDATAEVFLVVWRRLDDVPTGDGTLPWLYVTARNVLANQRRGRFRLAAALTRLRSDPPPRSIPPETVVVRREQDEKILEALARLRPQDREVIQLATWEELPQKTIGSMLGCSDRAVTMRLHRALRRLRHELRSYDISPIAPALAPETEAAND